MNTTLTPTRTEWTSFLVLMPALTLVLNKLFFGDHLWTDYRILLFSFPLVFLYGLVSWYVHIAVMHWLRVRFPHIRQTSHRLTLLVLSHTFLTGVTFALLYYGYQAVQFGGYHLSSTHFKTSLLLVIPLTLLATTMWEADYIFRQWKESIAEKEKLQQLTLQHEFDTLKSQVNPHFLFNCFNTLSSLITEDPDGAEYFLDELSKVYRYLLRNNGDGLTTLENEMRFISSYYKLLETRYGEGLQLAIEIDKRYDQYILPSLSLQLLVENAVKHNIVSKSRPLVIDIFTAAGNVLVVNNTLQPKASRSVSNNIGLQNIRAKYELIKQPGFQVLQDELNFSVVLPLIWSPVLNNQIITAGAQQLT